MSSAFGYAGEQWDNSAGLLYLRARYYEPVTGRFITRDPFPGFLYLPQTLHPYAYVGNNAINLTDPSGRFAPILLPIIGAIAGGGFAAWHYIEAHPCVDFLHSPEFWRIVLIGAGAGAVGFTVGFAVGVILPSGGLGWAIIGGIVSGGISGAAERLTYSLLSGQPITPRTILYAAATGTVTGGVFGGVGYGVSRIIQAFVNPPVAQAAGPMSPELYKIGPYGKLRHFVKGTKLRAHHILQNVWAEHNIPGYSYG